MELFQQLAAVAAVLALLAGSLWWLRRRGMAALTLPRRAGGRTLKSLERLPLGPQHALHLVRLGDKALLVACSPTGCRLLADLAWSEVETAREALP